MAKKLVKRNENVVRFFGKWRKLDNRGELKIGRMYVRIAPEMVQDMWCAELVGYDDERIINVRGARSGVAAVKKLERRVEALHRALSKICEVS